MTGFDVVIVGAGAAGCLLAKRLSADPARRVLLLEAGVREPPLASRMPGSWISLINSEVDWGYHTVPQARCFGSPIGLAPWQASRRLVRDQRPHLHARHAVGLRSLGRQGRQWLGLE